MSKSEFLIDKSWALSAYEFAAYLIELLINFHLCWSNKANILYSFHLEEHSVENIHLIFDSSPRENEIPIKIQTQVYTSTCLVYVVLHIVYDLGPSNADSNKKHSSHYNLVSFYSRPKKCESIL